MEKIRQESVVEAIRGILQETSVGGQEELRGALAERGFDVTQSTISRALKKLGAVRTYNEDQEPSYVLPAEDLPPPVNSTIVDLVQNIDANENLIVIATKPGSASLLARQVDFGAQTVLGTIAGDDCVLVIPKSVKKIHQTVTELQNLLGWRK
jgi:transcriptional regulator of arginine metabolism